MTTRDSRLPRFLASVLIAWVSLVGCSRGSYHDDLRGRIPPAASSLIFVDPAALEGDVALGRAVGWPSVVDFVRQIGLDPGAFRRLALAELETFDAGVGNFFVGVARDVEVARAIMASTGGTPLRIEGIEFSAAETSGWYRRAWDDVTIVECDAVGCQLAAGLIAGRTRSLFDSPPEAWMRELLEVVDVDREFALLWRPKSTSRDLMEAGSVWTGVGASVYFRSVLPAAVFDRLGFIQGAAGSAGRGRGDIQHDVALAMSSPESARFVSGSLQALDSVAKGINDLAKSMGFVPPENAQPPDVRVTSRGNLVVARIRTP